MSLEIFSEKPPEAAMLTEPLVPAAALAPMLDPARTALLIIDAQVDFIAPDGAMGRIGLDFSGIEPALQRIEKLIAAARAVSVAPIFVRVLTRPDTDSDALKLLFARKGRPPQSLAICREGTVGADYYGVRPEPGDMEIGKVLFSSFNGTTLAEQLRERGLDTLVVVGFSTDCCVDCTVRDAFHHNFNVFVVTDACAAYETPLHYGALNGLGGNCALLVETDSVLAAWS